MPGTEQDRAFLLSSGPHHPPADDGLALRESWGETPVAMKVLPGTVGVIAPAGNQK